MRSAAHPSTKSDTFFQSTAAADLSRQNRRCVLRPDDGTILGKNRAAYSGFGAIPTLSAPKWRRPRYRRFEAVVRLRKRQRHPWAAAVLI